jgi:hypothetical protein
MVNNTLNHQEQSKKSSWIHSKQDDDIFNHRSVKFSKNRMADLVLENFSIDSKDLCIGIGLLLSK